MLMRYQILAEFGSHVGLTPTPIPSPHGVTFLTPEILGEGDPRGGNTASRTSSGRG